MYFLVFGCFCFENKKFSYSLFSIIVFSNLMYLVSQDLKERIFISASFPSKFNLRMEWNFGFIVMMVYFFQIITGIIITFFFKIGFLDCLKSKCFILKRVILGWVITCPHIILLGFIFFLMNLHIFKSLCNPIFIYKLIWASGFIIFFSFSIILFPGYSLVAECLGFWIVIVFMNMVEFFNISYYLVQALVHLNYLTYIFKHEEIY